MKTNQYVAVHEEFVRVLHGVSSLYRFGSDRINNAEDYVRKHAKAMAEFDSPELHPDTRQMYRNMAREQLPLSELPQEN